MTEKAFSQSEVLLQRAMKVIPGGTQTFSKSVTQFPRGVSPYYIERGEGARVWDVDGNVYTDFISALHAILLGYQDPDVNRAVRQQMENGLTFSLPHPIEVEVAELIVDIVPSAQKVRFGKNGSDATAGAIRAARGFTGRDRIAVCGYHGWQDWYIGTTSRDLGVPKATKEMSHTFTYNDPDSLEALLKQYPGEFAAVIMEPMNMVEPAPGFLEFVRQITTREKIVLVFDEMITGFRFAVGGAQSVFGVTPDLTTLGKGVANGYPLSILAGRADIMDVLAESFFSFTMGCEALSLTAAKAVINKLKSEPVLDQIHDLGRYLTQEVKVRVERHGVGHFMSLTGHPSWTFWVLKDVGPYTTWDLKTLFIQETIAEGILCLGTHNLNYAHTKMDVDHLLDAYDRILPKLKDAVDNQSLAYHLRCDPLVPLFKVR